MHRTASRALALALTVLASTACGARTDVAPFDASRTPTVVGVNETSNSTKLWPMIAGMPAGS